MYNYLVTSTSIIRMWTVAAVLAATCAVGADTVALYPSKDNSLPYTFHGP